MKQLSVLLFFFGIALASLGLRILRVWFLKRRVWQASQDWPSVPGRILEPDSKQVLAAFSYTVDGLPYDKQLVFNGCLNPDEEISVFYNPKEPTEAVLSRAYPSGNTLRLAAGICGCVIGCSLAFGGGYFLLAR